MDLPEIMDHSPEIYVARVNGPILGNGFLILGAFYPLRWRNGGDSGKCGALIRV